MIIYRRMRAFKRWMKSQAIDCSDALALTTDQQQGASVRALCDLHEGDLVATIPKRSCLTVKTSGARRLIEAAGLEGSLGLSIAIMYERSLGPLSPWFGYLEVLPQRECIPLLWSVEDVDSLLSGTELHQIVREDKLLICEDWKEFILPILDSAPTELNPAFFGIEEYLAAKSLIASRSFEIDDYHGSGLVPLADLRQSFVPVMFPFSSSSSWLFLLWTSFTIIGQVMWQHIVPTKETTSLSQRGKVKPAWMPSPGCCALLIQMPRPGHCKVTGLNDDTRAMPAHGFKILVFASLCWSSWGMRFNHKTCAEDVHFTAVSSHSESDDDTDCNINGDNAICGDGEDLNHTMGDNIAVCEMIIVKDVKAGTEAQSLLLHERPLEGASSRMTLNPIASNPGLQCTASSTYNEQRTIHTKGPIPPHFQVFNTYGSLGNAALLHRYGFTESDNPFDIVNIDLELLLQWSSSLFSARSSRMRLSLWRKLGYTGCLGQDSEYFEISFDGEPQLELLILLYIMVLPEDAYQELDLRVSTMENSENAMGIIVLKKCSLAIEKGSDLSRNLLLTKCVRKALSALADIRESLYGSTSPEDDIEAMERCCRIRERMKYHSLMLRVSERRILKKLKAYAPAGAGLIRTRERTTTRKKAKRT
ncbi:hypothetical protein RJ639_012132 [Escallonia herrerae]|uniref:Rubisco LSMT substrate-binding domain-containing protein n=1 Tax=Escallonia herrerae TaxID=1293975 RepID=A0AA88VM12_9ASTE|nr:hypothetical protein RJ639_012132 [Escallonia herrerae]